MQHLIDLLHQQECSLVVKAKTGEVTTYNKKGVRDLVWLLDNGRSSESRQARLDSRVVKDEDKVNEPERLRGAMVADKVVGKAAAGLMVQGGVGEVYADVMSRLALPLFDVANIPYTFGELVDRIVIPEGDDRCPLEKIVSEATTALEVETMLRQHFAEMQALRSKTTKE